MELWFSAGVLLVMLAILVVNALFLAATQRRALEQVGSAYAAAMRDKAKLMDLLREVHDRIQAPDTLGFAQLRGIREPAETWHRSDADEAEIEARLNGK